MSELARPKIRLQGKAARVHTDANPLKYPNEAGTDWEYEYRDLSELKRIAEALPGKPVTMTHPPELGIDGYDLKPITVGRVVAARLDGEEIVVEYEIEGNEIESALDLVSEIKQNRQLSLGYKSALNQNRIQRLTEVDHLAMVDKARGGDTLETRMDSSRVHFDAMDAPIEDMQVASQPDLRHTSEVSKENEDLQAQIDAMKAECTELKTKLDTAERLVEMTKTELEQSKSLIETATLSAAKAHSDAEQKLADAELAAKAKFDAAVTEAVTVRMDLAKTFVDLGVDFDLALSNHDNKVAAIKHLDSKDLAEKPSWVDAWFVSASERHLKVKKDAAEIESQKKIEAVAAEVKVEASVDAIDKALATRLDAAAELAVSKEAAAKAEMEALSARQSMAKRK